MANAVVRAAQQRGLTHEEMHSQVQYLVAHGIASTVKGEKVIIGSTILCSRTSSPRFPPGSRRSLTRCRRSIPICIWPWAAS